MTTTNHGVAVVQRYLAKDGTEHATEHDALRQNALCAIVRVLSEELVTSERRENPGRSECRSVQEVAEALLKRWRDVLEPLRKLDRVTPRSHEESE